MGDTSIFIEYSANKAIVEIERHQINKIVLSDNVSTLKCHAADLLALQQKQIDLVYCGKCMQDDKSLEWYGIISGATILALKKVTLKDDDFSKPVDEGKLAGALKVLRHRNSAKTLDSILSRPSTLNDLLLKNGSLASDPIAQALLQDSNLLLLCLKDETSRKSTLEKHTALNEAIVHIASLVSAELKHPKNVTPRQQYNLDRMDDEDDDDEQQTNPTAQWMPTLPQGASITTDFFRQAMAAVAGTSNPTAPAPVQNFETQLQQLRDMGIADEALARQALIQTGGDIQAALSLIFDM